MEDFLTVEETAELLRLNVKRVQALARSGKLPALRSGRRWLFRRADLLNTLKTGQSSESPGSAERHAIDISARNQLRGRVQRVVVDGLMAEVHLDIGGQTLTALITRTSAERLGLKPGLE